MSDVELPAGWAWASLAEVAKVSGGIQKQPKRYPVKNKYPFLRVANVGRGSLDLDEIHEIELYDGELENYRLRDGDLLVVEGNGSPDQIGRAARWRGVIPDAVHQNHLIRVRPTRSILASYLELVWNAPVVSGQLRRVAQSTSGLYTLSTGKLNRVLVPLPPLAEQSRIVETLERNLSHLDAAVDNLAHAHALSVQFRRSALARIRDKAIEMGASVEPLGVVARTSLGKMLDSKKNIGIETPYLRNINVRWGKFDLDDISSVPMSAEQAMKLALIPGDLLVCEGGEPGRCAVWPGSDGLMTYQKALHRVRPIESVSPKWLALMIEESVRNGRTTKMLTGTTIKHLPQEKLRRLKIPIPAPAAQVALLDEFESTGTGLERLRYATNATSARGNRLKEALLNRAFTGDLVPQDPADEPASIILNRIRAERGVSGGAARIAVRRSRKGVRPVIAPAAPSADSIRALTDAVQQELPL